MLASSFGGSAYVKRPKQFAGAALLTAINAVDLKWFFTDTWQSWEADPWPRAVFLTLLILRTETMVTVWIKRELRVEVFAETAPFLAKSGRK